MGTKAVLADAYTRINQGVHRIAGGLDENALSYRPDADANSIGWLLWHLLRVQDHHISHLARVDQAWVDDGWAGRFAMAADAEDIGYGHSSYQVAAIHISDPQLLVDYADAVHARTLRYIEALDDAELERVVDVSYDPPVTAAVRLVSVIGDDMQHLGQAAYVRGLYERLS